MAVKDSGKVLGKEIANEVKKVSDNITSPFKQFMPGLIAGLPGGGAMEKSFKALKISNKKEADDTQREIEKQTESIVGSESILRTMNENLMEMSFAMTGMFHAIKEPEDTSLSAAEVEKSNEEKRAADKQITLLEQIGSGISGLLKSFLDSAAKGAGMGVGAIAGLIAAPVIAMAAFFKSLKAEFAVLSKFTKGLGSGKLFAPVRFLFSTISKIVKASLGVQKAALGLLTRIPVIGKAFASIGQVFASLPKTIGAIAKGADLGGFFKTIGKVITGGVGKIKGIFTSVVRFFSKFASFAKGASKSFGFFSKFAAGFGSILGKIFLPITILMSAFDFITGFMDGYKEDGILGGLEGGLSKLFANLIGMPLDLLKSAVSWIAGVFGFDGVSAALDSFSFKTLITDLIGGIFDGIDGVFAFLGDLFDFSDLSMFEIFGKLIDIVFLPVNLAINFVKGLFGWGTEGEDGETTSFSLSSFIFGAAGAAITWIKEKFMFGVEAVSAIAENLIGLVLGGVTGAIDFVKGLFSFGEEGVTALGVFQKLIDIVYLPLNLAVNFVKGLFGWGDPDEPFSLGKLITDTAASIFDWFKGLFNIDIGGLIKSIPGAGKVLSWFGFGDEEPPAESPAADPNQQRLEENQDNLDLNAMEMEEVSQRMDKFERGQNAYFGRDTQAKYDADKMLFEQLLQREGELERANLALQEAIADGAMGGGTTIIDNSQRTSNQTGGQRMAMPIPISNNQAWEAYGY
jgi:hypothetical protein